MPGNNRAVAVRCFLKRSLSSNLVPLKRRRPPSLLTTFLEPDSSDAGKIWCSICTSFHGWGSHLTRHLSTPTHQRAAAEKKSRKITDYGALHPKSPGQATLPASTIFKQDTLRHVLATGHSPSTIHELLTPGFIEGLSLFGRELPEGKQLLRGYLDSTYETDLATIRSLIGN